VAGFNAGEFVAVVAVAAAGDGKDFVVTGGPTNGSGSAQFTATISLDAGVYTLKAIGDSGSEATGPLVVTSSAK
jgi:hypothetical protein